MYYHEGARLIYLAHPRTASVATAWELSRIGFKKVVPGDHHSRLWLESPNKPFTRETRAEWTVFTTVRNHWDTAVSWRFKRRSLRWDESRWDARSWKILFESNHWVGTNRMWWLHADEADVVLRYESLESQLRSLLGEAAISFTSLSEQNVTPSRKGRHYRDFFTEDGRDYIGERFRYEIERFGYRF